MVDLKRDRQTSTSPVGLTDPSNTEDLALCVRELQRAVEELQRAVDNPVETMVGALDVDNELRGPEALGVLAGIVERELRLLLPGLIDEANRTVSESGVKSSVLASNVWLPYNGA